MKAWKSMSLGLLLALSLVSYAVAKPASAPFLNGDAACTSAVPAVPAAPAARAEAPVAVVAPLAALWATNPPLAYDPFAPAGKVCSLHSCTGTGVCICPNGTHGTCVNGSCSF